MRFGNYKLFKPNKYFFPLLNIQLLLVILMVRQGIRLSMFEGILVLTIFSIFVISFYFKKTCPIQEVEYD